MKRIAILVDGGHLRARSRVANKKFSVNLIERVALAVNAADEEIYRILYYDCEEYSGTVKQPVSGLPKVFSPTSTLLEDLERKELFAVRRGVLKFRGFKPKSVPIGATPTDSDFSPDFEQKGVDMRIGLDIALFCQTKAVERIALITNDTDTIPALKYGRRAGLQIVIAELEGARLASDLPAHVDFIRPVLWPA